MEANTLVPCCLYPTSVVLIDDDMAFLEMLSEKLEKQELPCKTFSEFQPALDHIKNNQLTHSLVRKLSKEHPEDAIDSFLTNIEVKRIRDLVYDKNRFNGISVAIIDYAMPKENGISVCNKLSIAFLKKVMLTGQAQSDVAIKAFNENLIDRFYVKNLNSLQALPKELSHLQKAYFISLTNAIINDAVYERYPSMQCLKDKVFSRFFEDLCRREQIVEYYLTDIEGSFILFDNEARPSYLSVKTDIDIQYYYEIASDNPRVGSDILNAIKDKSKIPYFLSDEDYNIPANEWGLYLHEAICLEGEHDYYVAYIKNNPLYSVENQSDILPFKKYMRSIAEKM